MNPYQSPSASQESTDDWRQWTAWQWSWQTLIDQIASLFFLLMLVVLQVVRVSGLAPAQPCDLTSSFVCFVLLCANVSGISCTFWIRKRLSEEPPHER